MDERSPEILVIAGPNGVGKSTCAAKYLPVGMAFLNADEVAKELHGYPSAAADLLAGRIILGQMDEHESREESFAVETTLATRSLAPRIARLRQAGYRFHLVYVWSPSADFSVQRVSARVRAGGHHIPEETIRRRYVASFKNFVQLYRPIADVWDVLDNTSPEGLRLVASGNLGTEVVIKDPTIWKLSSKGEPMGRHESDVREPRAPEGAEMVVSMRQGVVEALCQHKVEGRSVIAWDSENGQVVEIPPNEIVIPEATANSCSVGLASQKPTC